MVTNFLCFRTSITCFFLDLHLCFASHSKTANLVQRPDIPGIHHSYLLELPGRVMSESQLSQDFQTTSEGKKSVGPDITSEQGTSAEENVFETLEEVQVHRTNNVLPSRLTHL